MTELPGEPRAEKEAGATSTDLESKKKCDIMADFCEYLCQNDNICHTRAAGAVTLSKAVQLRLQVPTGSFSLYLSLCELLGKLLIYE